MSIDFKPDAIIFDFDGTMVNSETATISIASPVISKYLGRQVSSEEMDNLKGKVWKKELQKWFPGNHEEVHMEIVRSWEKTKPDIRAYNGVSEILDIINENNVPMAVASSRKSSHLIEMIGKLSWDKYFETIVGQDDTTSHKPEPDPLILAAKRLGKRSTECIYIGDQVWDIRASKAAGMISGVALWGDGKQDVLMNEKPDFIFHSPTDIPKKLLQLMKD